MMLHSLVFATLASGAAAAHLSGPMDYEMNACMARSCPAFSTFMTAADFQVIGQAAARLRLLLIFSISCLPLPRLPLT